MPSGAVVAEAVDDADPAADAATGAMTSGARRFIHRRAAGRLRIRVHAVGDGFFSLLRGSHGAECRPEGLHYEPEWRSGHDNRRRDRTDDADNGTPHHRPG